MLIPLRVVIFESSEPVGSTKPKISGDKIQGLEERSGLGFSLLCPAQAFPVPFYR